LPSIVGRSPSYMFRQLYDFRHGARTGEWSPLMAQVVSNLEQEDMLAIVAYLASLDPWAVSALSAYISGGRRRGHPLYPQ
jgi:cytochrome c553